MEHTEQMHSERLGKICRICGGSSTFKSTQPVRCDRYALSMKKHYMVDIQTDRPTEHSNVMCQKCCKRLKRLENGQKAKLEVQFDIEFSKSIWTEFDVNKQIADCSVCEHFVAHES